jgi:hypothetical protein
VLELASKFKRCRDYSKRCKDYSKICGRKREERIVRSGIIAVDYE